MIIDYNTFFRLRVDVTKIREDLYELQMERVDLDSQFESTVQKYYFDPKQLKDLVNYLSEATHDGDIID